MPEVTNEEIMRLTENRCRIKRCCNSSVKITDDKILIVAPNIEIRETLPFRQLMQTYKDPMKCLQMVIAVGLAYTNLAFIEAAVETRRQRDQEEKQ